MIVFNFFYYLTVVGLILFGALLLFKRFVNNKLKLLLTTVFSILFFGIFGLLIFSIFNNVLDFRILIVFYFLIFFKIFIYISNYISDKIINFEKYHSNLNSKLDLLGRHGIAETDITNDAGVVIIDNKRLICKSYNRYISKGERIIISDYDQNDNEYIVDHYPY